MHDIVISLTTALRCQTASEDIDMAELDAAKSVDWTTDLTTHEADVQGNVAAQAALRDTHFLCHALFGNASL